MTRTDSTFDCPRVLYDAILQLPDAALRICLVVLRFTYGYYAEKNVPRGARIRRTAIANWSGLRLKTVHKWVPVLVREGVLIEMSPPNQTGARLRLNPDPAAWGVYSTQSTPGTPARVQGVLPAEHPNSPPSLDPPLSSETSDEEDTSFDVFRATYPRRDGIRGAAQEWAKLSPPERAAAQAVAERMRRIVDAGRKDAQYVKNALVWLAEHRWEEWTDGPPPGWEEPTESAPPWDGTCALCGDLIEDAPADVHGKGLMHRTCARQFQKAS